jgi:glycosyltransferase involved in cell wall biosynthesis
MKISFVIPAHNEEVCIGRCLDSVFKELKSARVGSEIIVVDNASTDKTAEVVKKYPEVKIVNEPQKGLTWARRAGFLAASGDLIANIDADTMLTPGWIQKVQKEFSRNPKLVAFSGPFIYYDLPFFINLLVMGLFYPVAFIAYCVNRFIFRGGSMLQGGNFVVRKSALEKIGGYNTNIYFYGEDSDIALRMQKVGQVKFSFGLPIYASGRRLAKEGVFTMGIKYGANYLWMVIFKKPLSNTALDIRTSSEEKTLKYKPQNKTKETIIAAATIIVILSLLAGIAYGVYSIIIKLLGILRK